MTLPVKRQTAIITGDILAGRDIPHLSIDEVILLADAAKAAGKGINGERDSLLIKTMFDGCFRVSEALQITPGHIKQNGDGWSVHIVGKGRKPRNAAISQTLAYALQAHAYHRSLDPSDRIFNITRPRVHQIISRAFQDSGVQKPAHVGSVHVLRHAGAIARLKATRNPRSLQHQLGHSSMNMTMRYLKTLERAEAIRDQQEVEFQWT